MRDGQDGRGNSGVKHMATQFGDERFEMGRVVNRAFGAIGRNAALFFGLATVLTVLPLLLLRFAVGTPGAGGIPALGSIFGITMLVGLVSSALLAAGVTRATVTDLQGERPTWGRRCRPRSA